MIEPDELHGSDELLLAKDAPWLEERIRELEAHAETYSVPTDEVRMLFAKPRGGNQDVVAMFQVVVIDQHGKRYPVGMTRQGDKLWKEDGMSRMDAVSRRYSLQELKDALARVR